MKETFGIDVVHHCGWEDSCGTAVSERKSQFISNHVINKVKVLISNFVKCILVFFSF